MNFLLAPDVEKNRPNSRFRNDDFGLRFGESAESSIITERYLEVERHFLAPLSRCLATPLSRFTELYSQWREETKNLSDIELICTHHCYQEIIGMGSNVLPWIFQLLKSGSMDYWFWALKAITGQDPVQDEHCGQLKLMAQDWVAWGQKNGYL